MRSILMFALLVILFSQVGAVERVEPTFLDTLEKWEGKDCEVVVLIYENKIIRTGECAKENKKFLVGKHRFNSTKEFSKACVYSNSSL